MYLEGIFIHTATISKWTYNFGRFSFYFIFYASKVVNHSLLIYTIEWFCPFLAILVLRGGYGHVT